MRDDSNILELLSSFVDPRDLKEIERLRSQASQKQGKEIPLKKFLDWLLTSGILYQRQEESKKRISNIIIDDNNDFYWHSDFALKEIVCEIIRNEISSGKSKHIIIDIIETLLDEKKLKPKAKETELKPTEKGKILDFNPDKNLSLNISDDDRHESEIPNPKLDREIEKMKDDPDE